MTIRELTDRLLDYLEDGYGDTPVMIGDKEIKDIKKDCDYSITAAEFPKVVLSTEDLVFLKKLQRLPYLATKGYGEKSLYVVSDCYEYIPTLARYEGEWGIDWVHSSENDSIKVITGATPEEAVNKAYDWCVKKGFIKL